MRSELLASSFVIDLWSKVILEDSKLVNLVLNNERLFCVHAETCEGRERGSFIKEVEVANGKLLINNFVYLKSGLLLFAHIVTLL